MEKRPKKLFRKLPAGQGKTLFLPRIRVSEIEHEEIMQRVEDTGNTYAAYMLNAALGRPMRSYVAAKIILELRELAEQQKMLAQSSRVGTDEYRALLVLIAGAIDAIGQGRVRFDS